MDVMNCSNRACANVVLFGDGWTGSPTGWRAWCSSCVQAWSMQEVIPALLELEQIVQSGKFAFGYLSYEAAAAFQLAARYPMNRTMPLVWFGICEESQIDPITMDDLCHNELEDAGGIDFTIQVPLEEYKINVETIKAAIGAGNTYQVNFTVPVVVNSSISTYRLFRRLVRAQPVPYAAMIVTKDWELYSLSPELFLERRAALLRTRPMKGTWRRGRTLQEDMRHRQRLHRSEKDRAENIMIIDMARNDLGRICAYGSVSVDRLFEVEPYASVLQMTSTVHGNLKGPLPLVEILAATFPAASITGAPKYRTMEMIRELENAPRGVYCGAIGRICPNLDFTFNVAIRTLTGSNGQYRMGVGSGIVWDSQPEAEYQEIHTKCAFLQARPLDFSLIETMRLSEDGAILFLREHMRRLEESACYWNFSCETESVMKRVLDYASSIETRPCALRLLLDPSGQTHCSHRELTSAPPRVRLRLSRKTVDSNDVFYFHKTTNRPLYQAERAEGERQGWFETIFRNERGHVTEGCFTNLFYRFDDRWRTPPVTDGLLPGIWRNSFLRQVNAVEQSVTFEQLQQADEVVIGNSVLGTIRVDEIVDGRG